MITKQDMLKDLTHERGGNGYAVVQWLPDDYCRVVGLTKDGIGNQALLAWTKLLSPTMEPKDFSKPNGPKVCKRCTPVQAEALMALAKDLESGKKIVRETHIVEV